MFKPCYEVSNLISWLEMQIPLFGIMSSDSADPFYWMRVILASNRGMARLSGEHFFKLESKWFWTCMPFHCNEYKN